MWFGIVSEIGEILAVIVYCFQCHANTSFPFPNMTGFSSEMNSEMESTSIEKFLSISRNMAECWDTEMFYMLQRSSDFDWMVLEWS